MNRLTTLTRVVLRGDELLNSTSTDSGHDTYDIITGWDGAPAGAVVEGTLMRVCVRK